MAVNWVTTALTGLVVQAANAIKSATSKVLLVQPLDEDGNVLEGGSGGAGGGAGVYSTAQMDCSVAYTAATQITITGLPALLDDRAFIQVNQWQSGDVMVAWKPDKNAFSFNSATGVLTVTGATFAATDTFDVIFWYIPKAFDTSGNQNIVHRSNPDWEQQDATTLLGLSNITANTTDYGYLEMGGYHYFTLQGKTSGTTPTDVLTVTIEATTQDDGTALASCEWDDITELVSGEVSFVDEDFFVVCDIPLRVRAIRVKYNTSNTGGSDCDLTVYAARSW